MTSEDDQTPVKTNKVADAIFIRIPYVIVGTLLLLAIGINIANIIGRYVFFSAIYWTEEILVFIVVWGVFIAVASITYRGAHLRMDLFTAAVPALVQRILGTFTALLTIFLSAIVVYQSWSVIALHWASGTRTFTVGVPEIIPNLAVPVGFTLIILAVLIRFRSYVTGRF